MQRRAAAMYVLFFLVIAVGALGFINLVDAPDESMDEFDFQLVEGSTASIDETEYTVSRIDAFSATMRFTVPDAAVTETIANESILNSTGVEYRVELPPVEDPTWIILHETYPDHGLETTEIDGVTYVQVEENDEITLIPEDQYLEEQFGPRERLNLSIGDSFVWDERDATVTIESITATGVDVSYIGPEERSLTLVRGETTEIAGTTYGVNFVGDDTIQLTTDIDAWDSHLDALDTWDERYLGFWGIGVLSILAAILIGGLSYLPRRR